MSPPGERQIDSQHCGCHAINVNTFEVIVASQKTISNLSLKIIILFYFLLTKFRVFIAITTVVNIRTLTSLIFFII